MKNHSPDAHCPSCAVRLLLLAPMRLWTPQKQATTIYNLIESGHSCEDPWEQATGSAMNKMGRWSWKERVDCPWQSLRGFWDNWGEGTSSLTDAMGVWFLEKANLLPRKHQELGGECGMGWIYSPEHWSVDRYSRT